MKNAKGKLVGDRGGISHEINPKERLETALDHQKLNSTPDSLSH